MGKEGYGVFVRCTDGQGVNMGAREISGIVIVPYCDEATRLTVTVPRRGWYGVNVLTGLYIVVEGS